MFACLLAGLLALAVISPAIAPAQSGAEEEYELAPNIPNPDEPGQSPSPAGDEPAASDTGTAPAAAPPAEPAATGTTGSGGGDGGGGGDKGGKGEASAQGPAEATRGATDYAAVPSVDTSTSDDGGAPVLLILLAAAAAACTGVALWRLRRNPPSRDRSRGTERTPGAASESQSI